MNVGAVGMQMKIRWGISRRSDYEKTITVKVSSKLKKSTRKEPPIYISTNPSDINPVQLRDLYTACNHSCHRFPMLDHNGKVVPEAVDLSKLRIAISHSSVVVSVFSNLNSALPLPLMCFGDLLRKFSPFPFSTLSPSTSQLVGFGRAVSDFALTASIYDVMVLPSLRRMGIGKMIVKRIIRILTNRDIYDIAALCSADERPFFKACGFGNDRLGSTAMMYARTVPTYPKEGDQIVK